MLKEMLEIIDESDLYTCDKGALKERISRTYKSYMLEINKREKIEAIDESSLSTEDKDVFKEFYLKVYEDYVQRVAGGGWRPADVYSYPSYKPLSPVLEELGMRYTSHCKE